MRYTGVWWVACVLLATLWGVTDASENEINFVFAGMIPGSSSDAVTAPGSVGAIVHDSCEDQLNGLVSMLDSPDTIAIFGEVVLAYLAAMEEYNTAAALANVSATVINPDTDVALPTPSTSLRRGMVDPVNSCANQLVLAQSQVASTSLEVQDLLDATAAYNALTEALLNTTDVTREEIVQRQASLYNQKPSKACPTSSSKGVDWKVFAMIATRTDNCDGSYSIYAKANALSYGFLDVSCTIRSSSDSCNIGSRYGVSVGIASAYLYLGLIFPAGSAKPSGMYFKPQVCYWYIFSSSCADTTLDVYF